MEVAGEEALPAALCRAIARTGVVLAVFILVEQAKGAACSASRQLLLFADQPFRFLAFTTISFQPLSIHPSKAMLLPYLLSCRSSTDEVEFFLYTNLGTRNTNFAAPKNLKRKNYPSLNFINQANIRR